MSKFKKSVVFLVSTVLLLPTSAGFADTINLSLQDAIEGAVSADLIADGMQDSIDDLWKQHDSALKGKQQVEKSLSSYESFILLHEKFEEDGILSASDQTKYKILQATWGKTPPVYTKEKMFTTFIEPRDFGHYALWTEIQKLKNSEKTVLDSIEVGVKELYNQTLNLTETVEAQRLYTEIVSRQYEEAKVKYELGQVSEIDHNSALVSKQIQDLEMQKLERNLFNLERSLMDMARVNVSSDLELASVNLSLPAVRIKSYAEALEQAMANRTEVVNAKLGLDTEQRESDIMLEYITNNLTSKRLDQDVALLEAKDAYASAVESVTVDVYTAWNALEEAKSDYELASKQYKNVRQSYLEAKKSYSLGLINETTLMLSEFDQMMKLNTLKAKLRQYSLVNEKLELAISSGPAYQQNGGMSQ